MAQEEGVRVLEGPPGATAEQTVSAMRRRGGWARVYLDRVVLAAPTEAAGENLLCPGLFEALGERYEHLVDTSRNVDAAARGFGLLVAELGSGGLRAVLDVGCGSGLYARAPGRPPVLVGWDPSPLMRTLAADAGLTVISSLRRPLAHRIQGAVAVYVLHLPGAVESAAQVLQLLPAGAPLIGNVHSSTPLDRILREATGADLKAEILDHPDSCHGPFLALRAGLHKEAA